MTSRLAAYMTMGAAFLTGGCATHSPILLAPGEEEAEVVRATADSGRDYLYFAPADFTQAVKHRSRGVTESARWLERTLFQHLDLDRHRVRVSAQPGYVEVGLSGRIPEAKLQAITEKIVELRDAYEDLSPIKLICRVGEDQGPPAGTTTVGISAKEASPPSPKAEASLPPRGEKTWTRDYDFPL
jgi:hypothetical protein